MFRSEGLAKALTDAGHEVSERTVDRWKAGTSKPSKGHLQAIRELVGADTTKEPPPDWAGEMEERIVSEVLVNREVLLEALAAGFAERAERELDEDNDDEEPDGTGDQPPGGAGPKPKPAT